MIQSTFQENPLFHFKPSEVTLEGILSFMLGLLQARQAFIFQETRPGQNQERLFRGEIVSCVQRRDCALLRAKTSALLRRKTCAVLAAWTSLNPRPGPGRGSQPSPAGRVRRSKK